MAFSAVWLQRILKVAILLLLLASLVYHIWVDETLRQLPDFWLRQNNYFNTLLWVLLLVPINWGIEALKWQYLIQRMTPISYLRAYKAVLAGVSFALFTPNRMGEYLGRVWVLKREYRFRGVLITLVNSFAQIIVTSSAGLVAAMIWVIQIEHFASVYVLWLGLCGVVGLVGLYFTLPYWVKRIERTQPQWSRKKWFRILRVMQVFPKKQLAIVLVYAFIRLATYSTQYILLLVALTPVSPAVAALAVPILFLFQMGIPVPAILEIGVRGSLAANLLSSFGASSISVLVAATTLWVVNLILPAMVGGVIIGTLKIEEKHV